MNVFVSAFVTLSCHKQQTNILEVVQELQQISENIPAVREIKTEEMQR
jgi:hypothetical protein